MNLWRAPKSEYNGLVARCAPGTHEAATAMLLRHHVPRCGVLDLASGTGAFLARLRDQRFDDLQAVELVSEQFAVQGITPRPLDLNSDVLQAFGRRFNVVTAIEIIEHLDSPRQLLRQVRSVLEEGGYLLVSTPNIANWLGRIKFAFTGELRAFEASQYQLMRHISPMTDSQMRAMLTEIGFELIDVARAGSFDGPLRRIMLLPVASLLRLFFGAKAFGDVTIYLARKAEPDQSSPGRNSSYHRSRTEHQRR